MINFIQFNSISSTDSKLLQQWLTDMSELILKNGQFQQAEYNDDALWWVLALIRYYEYMK